MKIKKILIILIISIVMPFLVVPLGAIGHQYKFAGAAILYFLVTLFLLNKATDKPKEKAILVLLIAFPITLLCIAIYSRSSDSSVSIPSSIAHFLGILFGALVHFSNRNMKITLSVILISFTLWMTFVGYDLYLFKVNFGTYSGDVKEELKDFTFVDDKGLQISNSQFRDKIVVMDFWNNHCGICFKKFPILQNKYNLYKADQDVKIFAVNIPYEYDSGKVSPKIDEYNFPKLFAKSELDAQKLGVKYFPTVLILKGNTIVYRGSIERIDEKIAELKQRNK